MENLGTNKENGDQEGITVAIRMRPLNKNEGEKQRVWKVLPTYNSITQTTNTGKPLSERVTGRTFFAFDKVFDEDINTIQVYDGVAKGIVASVVNGLNGTIFAYGQTSSGKTYTMQGSGTIQDGASAGGGIVHMAARDIFSNIQSQPNRMFLVRASFLEIYNEEVRDLLSNSSSTLQIREDPRRGVFVQSQEEMVTDFSSLLRLLFQGEKSRQVASTGMNERSSRSHTIFRITVESRENEESDDGVDNEYTGSSNDGAVRISTLNLVDLAGSESVRHTGATGDRQKEGGMINQSLLTLSRVIVALGQPNSMHINFRDSKLTRILQPSLSGNARMAIICCATPSELYLEETRSTLQFASRAKLVKTNAQVNEVLDDRSIIRKLQRELAEARGMSTGPGTEHLRALENKAANAGTEAMEAKKKLDRLKASILNAASLFGGKSTEAQPDHKIEKSDEPNKNLRSRKRRQSDGILPSRSTPLKLSANIDNSPKTAPRMKKPKKSLPQLSPTSELSILRQALSSRGELSRALQLTLEDSIRTLNKKEEALKGLESANDGLAEEHERALADLLVARHAFESVQGNLDGTIEQYDTIIAEKETVIQDAFKKVQVEKSRVTVLEEANGHLSRQLEDLRLKFDALQQERVRSAFGLAQAADEKEVLQAEREQDKLILAEMNQKIGAVTSQANDAEKKCNALRETVTHLQQQLTNENEEKATARAQAEELRGTMNEMKSDFDEERRTFEATREELEIQLETKLAAEQNALMLVSGLQEELKKAAVELNCCQESLLQLTSEREAERDELQTRIFELENEVASNGAEKDDFIAQINTLGEELQSLHENNADALSRLADVESNAMMERENAAKSLFALREQLEILSATKIQATEQAAFLDADIQRLQQELADLHALNHELSKVADEGRVQSELTINELRTLVDNASGEKIAALEQCVTLQKESESMMQDLQAASLRVKELDTLTSALEGKCNDQERELEACQVQEEQVSEQFEALQIEHTYLQEELENAIRQNVELETLLGDSREHNVHQVATLLEEQKSILCDKAELEALIASKDESFISLQSSYTSLRAMVTSNEIEKSDLLEQLGIVSNELETMRADCTTLEARIENFRENESSLQQELTTLREHHDRLTTRQQTLVNEIDTLEERLVISSEEKREAERLFSVVKDECSAWQEKNETLENGISELRKKVDSLEESLLQVHEERNRLLGDNAQLEKTIGTMNLEIRKMSEEIGNRDAERIEMESRVMSLETKKMAALAEKDFAQVNHHEQTQALEDRIAESEEQIERLACENEDLGQKCDQYEAKVKQLAVEVDALQASQANANANGCALEQRLQTLNHDLEGARSCISTLEAENLLLSEKLQEVEKFSSATITSLQSELCNIKQSQEETAVDLQRCQMELESVRSAREKTLNTLREREQERDKAVAAMEDMFKKNQELSKSMSNALTGEKRAVLEMEIVDLRQSSLELKQLLVSTTGSENRLREKLAAAENEVILKTRALDDAQYRLSQLEDELRQSELAFEQHLALDVSKKLSQEEPQDLLKEIESLNSTLNHEREDRMAAEQRLKKQMGDEQRLLIQEGEKRMGELRCTIQELECRLSESEHEAYTSRKQVDQLNDEKQSAERGRQELQTTFEQLNLRLAEREGQMSSIQAELIKAKEDLFSFKENALELKEKVKFDATVLQKLERENNIATSELALLKRQIAIVEKSKVDLQAECDRLVAKIKSSSSDTMQSMDVSGEVKNLKVSLLKRDEKIKQLKSTIESIRHEPTTLTEELQHLKVKIAEKDQRIKKLQQVKLTKEFAEEHKQLMKDNKRLREEVAHLQSEMRSTETESAMRTELSALRFDKEALENKLRKFAAHCQRLENDKVGVIDALRSCNINVASYNEVKNAVVSLCDQLASLQESGSVASRRSHGSSNEQERVNQALQLKLDRLAASEERLSEQVSRYRNEAEELRKKLKDHSEKSDSDTVTSDIGKRLRYLEQENLHLMHNVKTTKKQLQAAREEIEVLRINATDNTTLDFGTVDLGSLASSDVSKASGSQGRGSDAKKGHLLDKTNNISNSSNKRPAVSLPNRDKHDKSQLRSRVPGLGENAVHGDDTAECKQS